jgi:predicted nucleic acid-binding protein
VIYLLDTGPLVSALAREGEEFGDWAKDLLRRLPTPLYTCDAVLVEASHLLGSAEPVLAAVRDGLLVCPWNLTEHHGRLRELVQKYADQPMDLADACLVAMSEEWWDCKVITIDTNDFKVYRRRGRHAIPLVTPTTD